MPCDSGKWLCCDNPETVAIEDGSLLWRACRTCGYIWAEGIPEPDPTRKVVVVVVLRFVGVATGAALSA